MSSFAITQVHAILIVGNLHSKGDRYQYVVVKFKAESPSKIRTEWVKSQFQQLDLIAANADQLEDFRSRCSYYYPCLHWLKSIAAISQSYPRANNQELCSQICRDTADKRVWYFFHGIIKEGTAFLAIQRIEE